LQQVARTDFREFCQRICDELRALTPRYDWVGIYWVEGSELALGPWSGRHATVHTRIPISQGICGAAVRDAQTVIVDDVQSDPRYLACFLETRSEIVVPIYANQIIIGEIDIDGKEVAGYTNDDKEFLEALANEIGSRWPGAW
jgi:GAF domain-containing protein